jgi:glycosyltransferase involved in cell wall biosynthesis
MSVERRPRVAFFPDSFHEVNGAALTCRQLEAFAERQGRDFMTVRCGPREFFQRTGHAWRLQMRRGKLAFPIDRDLHFDPLLILRRKEVLEHVRAFAPDLIHITSPGDVGILGAWIAHVLKVPLVASWHTNLHEFAGRRLRRTFSLLPGVGALQSHVERFVLRRVLWFFSRAEVSLAPNPELVQMIAARSQRPSFLMTRGVDTTLFTQSRRNRQGGPFTLGFVGRLNPEKNVRFLATLEKALLAAGAPPFRFMIVGGGSETGWLQANLENAQFTGILSGEALGRAYANMDLFVFPSQTDTFGNVVREALASGVPAVVTNSGGPKFLVEHGVTGFVAESDQAFIDAVLTVMNDPALHQRLRAAAPEAAVHNSWDRVFESEVYAAYRFCVDIREERAAGQTSAGRPSAEGRPPAAGHPPAAFSGQSPVA